MFMFGKPQEIVSLRLYTKILLKEFSSLCQTGKFVVCTWDLGCIVLRKICFYAHTLWISSAQFTNFPAWYLWTLECTTKYFSYPQNSILFTNQQWTKVLENIHTITKVFFFINPPQIHSYDKYLFNYIKQIQDHTALLPFDQY